MTVRMTVPDIACNACVQAIRTVLANTPGVRSSTVDITSKKVQVDFDEAAIDLPRIKGLLADADFPVAETEALS